MSATAVLPAPWFGVAIADAVPAEWCAARIAAIAFGATTLAYPRGYRDNDRAVLDDPALAAWLFARVRGALPATREADGARWEVTGLNPRFRACRYRDGQAFAIHRDGAHAPSEDERSWWTLQIYLDDAPARGGHTRFYADRSASAELARIAPRRGTALVFDHRAWHDGEAVTAGVKHVLRTDVMFRRTSGSGRVRSGAIGQHRGYVWRVAACADGAIASAGRDGTVRRWTAAGEVALDLGHGSVTALCEDAAGRLWAGTRSGALFVLAAGGPRRVTAGHGAILAATALPAGGIAATTAGGELLELDAAGAIVRTTAVHAGWAWGVVAAEGALVTTGDDGRVVATAAGRATELGAIGRPARALARDPEGAWLVGARDGSLHRLAAGARESWAAHGGAITSLAVARGGAWAASSEDGTISRWSGPRALARTAPREDFVTSLAFDRADRLVAAGYDGAVWLVSPAAGGDAVTSPSESSAS